MWTKVSARFEFLNKLCGGVPANPDLQKKWLEARRPTNRAPAEQEHRRGCGRAPRPRALGQGHVDPRDGLSRLSPPHAQPPRRLPHRVGGKAMTTLLLLYLLLSVLVSLLFGRFARVGDGR